MQSSAHAVHAPHFTLQLTLVGRVFQRQDAMVTTWAFPHFVTFGAQAVLYQVCGLHGAQAKGGLGVYVGSSAALPPACVPTRA